MLLGTCRLTGLSADLFAYEQDTFALVRLGLTERANLGTNLSEELLVAGLQDDEWVLVTFRLGLDLDFGGELKQDGVSVAEGELQEIALVGHTVAHADELELLLIAFGHTYDHIVDEGAVEAVEGLLLLCLYGVVLFYDLKRHLTVGEVDLD